MKRLFVSVLFFISVLATLCVASCTSDKSSVNAIRNAETHVHAWSDYVTVKNATCTETGEKVKYCSCGASVSIIIEPTGHLLEEGFACSERRCLNEGCDYVEPKAEHAFSVKETVPPSCTEKGYTVYACECGEERTGDETEPAGHVYGDWETPEEVTCTDDGKRLRSCTVCGFEETEILPSAGHKYESSVIPATCETGGYTEHTCVDCGYSYVDSETAPLWHVLDSDFGCCERHCIREGCSYCEPAYKEHDYSVSSVVAPTCTEEGYTVLECACGAIKYADYVPPAEHSFVTKEFEAACTECAYTESVCSACGFTVTTVTAPALGHLYEKDFPCCDKVCLREGCAYTEKASMEHEYTETVTPSTCTVKGSIVTACTVCGSVTHYAESELAAHDFTAVTVNASCTEPGYTEYICKACAHVCRDDYTEALGHLYSTDAECIDRKCIREGCIHTEPASAEHDFAATAVSATCTEPGYTEYICKACRYYYRDDYVDALGHLYATDAECIDRECIREGCTHVEPASAEHSYTELTVAPSCSEDGYTEHICLKCDYSYRDDFVAALGHLYGTDAECVARECVREGCAHTESAGHDYVGGLCTRCDDVDQTYDCGDIIFKLNYSSYCVTGFIPSESDTRVIIVPDEYNGIAVTSIADFALSPHPQIECIVLGKNFTSLNSWSLYGVNSLRILILPYYCSLEGVTLPSGVTVISY